MKDSTFSFPEHFFTQYVYSEAYHLSIDTKNFQLYIGRREDITNLILKKDQEEREESQRIIERNQQIIEENQRALNEKKENYKRLLDRFNVGQNAAGFNSTAHYVFNASQAVEWDPSIKFLQLMDENEKPSFVSRIKRAREEKENIEPKDNRAERVEKRDERGSNHDSKRLCVTR
ncbi:hypothetical protein NF27_IN00480 [Candidatus Jidaibacter acanthamoeba]|uniref:Uncharacterized protein n=1 Tax=Candidatus Jidaibacter acanthamoebae TaxID=86105 RepID=A0A0C1MQM0_9RICK|nr:hypothetical protein [Candidatus Jidaibacter acanthamoeba]KIE04307.1 hypothetical protein NF27_IN00480 [Candidatus Jidaibacter acanthamoeba]